MVALLCAAVPLLVSAQNDSPDVSEPNPVVVTASRIEEPLAAAVVSVTIITRADVDRLRPRSVADLRASCCCGRTGEVQVLFANASNRSYETPLYYNLPGRSAYLTLRYVPQSHT